MACKEDCSELTSKIERKNSGFLILSYGRMANFRYGNEAIVVDVMIFQKVL